MATTISTSKARVDFAEMINQVAYGGERVVLDRHGKPIAAIIPIDDLTFLEEIENRMDIDAAKRALAESDERIPYEKLRQELGKNMAYTISLTKAAAKDLAAVPKKPLQNIDHTIRSLADNPRPHGSIKLQGGDNLYRIRKGAFRIIYSIEDEALIVTVVRVGNRRDVYRGI